MRGVLMGLPKEIADLIERFDRNLETYKSGQYNEAQLRQDFLNPFFGALGWDMANKAGYAEAYREVIHEDALKIGGATKAPVSDSHEKALHDKMCHLLSKCFCSMHNYPR